MSQDMAQTIHRDPQLLYSHLLHIYLSIQLTLPHQLLDPLPHNRSHGTPTRPLPSILTFHPPNNASDPNRHPPTLRHRAHDANPQSATGTGHPRATVAPARHHAPHQRLRALGPGLPVAQKPARLGLPERRVLEGSGKQGQAAWEPNDGSGGHGGHDGHDEGEHGYDDSADFDYELD